MKKWSICRLVAILILLIQNKAQAQKVELIKKTILIGYPSASALEYHHNQLYVIGDDATHILILTNQHKVVDSLQLFSSDKLRMSKEEKADIEAAAIIRDADQHYLAAFGSFSGPNRNKIFLLDLEHKTLNVIDAKLKKGGLKELNIEGAAVVNNRMVLSNRANNTHKENKLVVASFNRKKGIKRKPLKLVHIELPPSKNIGGISGLAYHKEGDLLLFTVSTEQTNNAYDDGEIGESFIGYIRGISKKLEHDTIKVDGLVSLDKLIAEKEPQKIESIAVEKKEANALTIHLAADNDNGTSSLFKMKMTLDNNR